MGIGAFAIAFLVLVFVEIAAGIALNKILKEEKKTDLIQELPAIRLPNPKAVLIKTYYRIYWFLKEALPVFLIAAVVLTGRPYRKASAANVPPGRRIVRLRL